MIGCIIRCNLLKKVLVSEVKIKIKILAKVTYSSSI